MMSISANETYQHLVKILYDSNLHFVVTETPYSAQIVIRKRFLKNKSGPSSNFLSERNTRQDDISDFILKNQEIQKNSEDSREIIEVLENKLAGAEVDAMNAHEEKKKETSILKNSLKIKDTKICDLKKVLETSENDILKKDEVIEKLGFRCEGLEINNNKLKLELNEAKTENEQLLERKDDKLKESNEENRKLKEKMDSLLDILYGCHECGLCDCECNATGESNDTDSPLSIPSALLCPPPSSASSPWTPPPTPPCIKCNGVNFGPSPTNVCFACIPPLQNTSQPSSSSPSRTPPGTPPQLR